MTKPNAAFAPAVVLNRSHRVNVDGKTHKGFLGSDAASVFVEWKKSGLVKAKVYRTPVVLWDDVLGYEITGNERGGGVSAALNHTSEHARSTLVLKTATKQQAFTFTYGPAALRNLLGDRLAAVDARTGQLS